eukprot:jgi/Tetstr1/433126/TSEL_022458.t1
MSPQQYARMFAARELYPPDFPPLRGVRGRSVRGVKPEHFEKPSDEPGKKFSWICTPGTLQPLLGLTPCVAMVQHVGFSTSWLRERLSDGTSHKLVLFPDEATLPATWANFMASIRETFGEDVHAALAPHLALMESTPWPEIDPSKRFRTVSHLAVADKYGDPAAGTPPQPYFTSASRLLRYLMVVVVLEMEVTEVGVDREEMHGRTDKAGQ